MRPSHGVGWKSKFQHRCPGGRFETPPLRVIAVAAALAGNRDLAFEYLEKAYSDGDNELLIAIRRDIRARPGADSISRCRTRSHRRFTRAQRFELLLVARRPTKSRTTSEGCITAHTMNRT